MSKSGSRYGRRSNWFKIHCLLQEQSNNNNTIPQASPSPNMLAETSKALHKASSNNNENSSSSWSPSLLPPHHHKKQQVVTPESPPPQRSTSGLIPGYAANSEASLAALTAAAFWASRNNTLLPPDLLSPHNQASLSPFFASAASPFANKSFLFPFHPSSPKHHLPVAPHLSTSTTHSPPPSSPASSSAASSPRTSCCGASPKPQDEEVEGDAASLSGLALLRTLGPVQDSPMDLSVKPPSRHVRLEEARARRRTDSGGGRASSADEERERPTKPPTPLDLTAAKV
jgi:hypothetical protein